MFRALRALIGALFFLSPILTLPQPAAAAGADFCPPGQSPHYVFGFANLQAQLGDRMGTALTCEFPDPNGTGDVHQRTTKGLAFWRKRTNTPTFTNGSEHWALTANGPVYWTGPSIDPPASAISSSPVTTAVVPPAAGSILPVVAPYSTDAEDRCFTANPSCGRDVWWTEWNELQSPSMVRYSAVGTGFTTEFRFREAINLLWQWPEGKELLRNANHSGVKVVAGSLDNAFANYRSRQQLVTVNAHFTEVSTWMLADIIGHELRHASDFAAGLWQSNSSTSCLGAEQSAYLTEHRFMVWLSRTLHPDGLPNRDDLLSEVTTEDRILARSLYEIGTSVDMAGLVRRDYHESCQV